MQAGIQKPELELTRVSLLVACALGDVGILQKWNIWLFVILLNIHLVQKSEKLKEEDGTAAGLVTALCQQGESAD